MISDKIKLIEETANHIKINIFESGNEKYKFIMCEVEKLEQEAKELREYFEKKYKSNFVVFDEKGFEDWLENAKRK